MPECFRELFEHSLSILSFGKITRIRNNSGAGCKCSNLSFGKITGIRGGGLHGMLTGNLFQKMVYQIRCMLANIFFYKNRLRKIRFVLAKNLFQKKGLEKMRFMLAQNLLQKVVWKDSFFANLKICTPLDAVKTSAFCLPKNPHPKYLVCFSLSLAEFITKSVLERKVFFCRPFGSYGRG